MNPDVSDIIAPAVKRFNNSWEEIIKSICEHLQFNRGKAFLSEFHDLEIDTLTKLPDPTGKISKVIFERKTRESTEGNWKVRKLEIITSVEWKSDLNFQSFFENNRDEAYSRSGISLNAFFTVYIKRLQVFFKIETEVFV